MDLVQSMKVEIRSWGTWPLRTQTCLVLWPWPPTQTKLLYRGVLRNLMQLHDMRGCICVWFLHLLLNLHTYKTRNWNGSRKWDQTYKYVQNYLASVLYVYNVNYLGRTFYHGCALFGKIVCGWEVELSTTLKLDCDNGPKGSLRTSG